MTLRKAVEGIDGPACEAIRLLARHGEIEAHAHLNIALGELRAALSAEGAGDASGDSAGWRMDAYYYSFERTGVAAIDKVLSAVACAGKSFHHTDSWNDEASAPGYLRGMTPVDWIQNAANEAADAYAREHPATPAVTKCAQCSEPFTMLNCGTCLLCLSSKYVRRDRNPATPAGDDYDEWTEKMAKNPVLNHLNECTRLRRDPLCPCQAPRKQGRVEHCDGCRHDLLDDTGALIVCYGIMVDG